MSHERENEPGEDDDSRLMGSNSLHDRVESSDEILHVDGECDFDEKLAKASANSRARKQLVTALVIGSISALGELIGGIAVGSLAVIADAVHDGFDAMSFAMSLFFLNVTQRKGSSTLTYGWLRGEAMGALVSLFWIYVVTALIVAEAFSRISLITQKGSSYRSVDGVDMFFLGLAGLAVDLTILYVFRSRGNSDKDTHGHSHGFGFSHSHASGGSSGQYENVNVLAAYMHALSHAMQDIGVLIAAIIIWSDPSAQLADPITTIIFAIAGLAPTYGVLKSLFRVFMQGTPETIAFDQVHSDLLAMKGVRWVRDLHIWSISTDIFALTACFGVDATTVEEIKTLKNSLRQRLKLQHGISHATLEIDVFESASNDRLMKGELQSCYEIDVETKTRPAVNLGKRVGKRTTERGEEEGILLTSMLSNREAAAMI